MRFCNQSISAMQKLAVFAAFFLVLHGQPLFAIGAESDSLAGTDRVGVSTWSHPNTDNGGIPDPVGAALQYAMEAGPSEKRHTGATGKGCSLSTNDDDQPVDPLLILLTMIAILFFGLRLRKIKESKKR